jgi:catechol 2,3-dioxygenase-like lactoylglutathione lyase family enzyme
MISGLNHITLSVRDVDRSFHFYADTLGLKPLARWPGGAYLVAGDLWLCLTLDERTRSSPLPEYSHIALSVSSRRFDEAAARIRSSGAAIWQDNRSEGASLYFLDPDGHKLEIHAGDWHTRLAAMKENPWDANIEYFD